MTELWLPKYITQKMHVEELSNGAQLSCFKLPSKLSMQINFYRLQIIYTDSSFNIFNLQFA